LLLIGGIVDFGRAMYTQNVMTNAAREGARVAALGYPGSDITGRVDDAMFGFATGGYTVQWGHVPPPPNAAMIPGDGCPSAPKPGDRQRVVVTATPSGFDYIILGLVPGFSNVAPTLSSQAEMRCAG